MQVAVVYSQKDADFSANISLSFRAAENCTGCTGFLDIIVNITIII